MQFSNLFVTFLLSTAVAAKGNKTTKAVTDKSLCKEMAKLEATVALAANTTKLTSKAKGNTTKVAEFEAKASEAATTLATMQSNTTLVSTCNVIFAAAKVDATCDEMNALQKLVSLAANTTKVDEETKGNATKASRLQAKASKAATKLAKLQSNSTLTSACTAEASAKSPAKAEVKAAAASASTSASASASATSASSAGMLNINAQTGVLSTIIVVAAGMMML